MYDMFVHSNPTFALHLYIGLVKDGGSRQRGTAEENLMSFITQQSDVDHQSQSIEELQLSSKIDVIGR